MFEFLFKYPSTVFAKGSFVLLGQWPLWSLSALLVACAGGLGWVIWTRRRAIAPTMRGPRTAVVWILQSLLVCLLLFLLWQPALSIATLRPQQNIVAVVIDDSKSMSTKEDGHSRKDQVLSTLNSGLLNSLKTKFQVRLYRMGDHLERIESADKLNASAPATHIGDSLKEVLADSATLPIGAVVLMSDGADNSGGIDLETISEIKRQRIPIHTVGFGRERMEHDVELTDVQLPARSLAKSRLQAQVTFHQWGLKGDKARLVVRDSGKILDVSRHCSEGRRRRANRNGSVQCRRRRSEEPAILHRPLAGRGEQEQQRTDAGAVRGRRQAARSVSWKASRAGISSSSGARWKTTRISTLYTIVRTTQNKIYTQVPDEKTTPRVDYNGFPTKVDDLFAFQGLILGSVEANYFTPAQQDLIQQFVDRRGGGLLFLGGRTALADGGYEKPPFADLLPVRLAGSQEHVPSRSRLLPN